MLKFGQTSSSNSCAISELPRNLSRLDSSARISSAAASRSAGLQERTRFRCSSISSRIVNLPSALGIQARFENRPDDFILSYFYEMESRPRERVFRIIATPSVADVADGTDTTRGTCRWSLAKPVSKYSSMICFRRDSR
jgi:hypothetical protein